MQPLRATPGVDYGDLKQNAIDHLREISDCVVSDDVLSFNRCRIASATELRYLASTLGNLSATLMSALAPEVIEHAERYEPVLELPKPEECSIDPAALLRSLQSLETHVQWSKLTESEVNAYTEARLCIDYVITLASRCALGCPDSETAPIFINALHALDQSARSLVFSRDSLAKAYGTIPSQTKSHEKAHVSEEPFAITEEDVYVPPTERTNILRKLSALCNDSVDAMKRLATRVLGSMRMALAFPVLLGFGAGAALGKAAAEKLAKVLPVLDINLKVPLSLKLAVKGIGKLTSEAVVDLSRRGSSLIKGALAGGESQSELSGNAKLQTQTEQKHRLKGRAAQERRVHLGHEDRERRGSRFDKNGKESDRGGRGDFGSQYSRNSGLLGDISRGLPEFMQRLSVDSVGVLSSPNGNIQRLDVYLQRNHPAWFEENIDSLYPTSSFLPALKPDKLPGNEEQIKLPIVPGAVTLPMPHGFTLTSVEFLDKNQQVIDPQQAIVVEECIFGSAYVVAPAGADAVVYRLRETEEQTDPTILAELSERLPRHLPFQPPSVAIASEAMTDLRADKQSKLALWLDRQVGFVYSKDPFISTFVHAAGRNFSQALLGLRSGMCDPFAVYTVSQLPSLGLNGLVIGGMVPKEHPRRGYHPEVGHAQALALTDTDAMVVDLTLKSLNGSYDSAAAMDWPTRTLACRTVATASPEQVYKLAREIREVLDGERSIESTSLPRQKFGLASKGISLSQGLINSMVKKQEVYDCASTAKLSHGSTLALPDFHKAFNVLVAARTLDYLVIQARSNHQVSPVVDYMSDGHINLYNLSEVEKDYLPLQYRDFNHTELISRGESFVIEALAKGQLIPQERELAWQWVEAKLPVFVQNQLPWKDALRSTVYCRRPQDTMLSLAGLEAIATFDLLGTLSGEQREGLLVQILAYFSTKDGTDYPFRDYTCSESDRQIFAKMLRYVNSHLLSQGAALSTSSHVQIVGLLLANAETARMLDASSAVGASAMIESSLALVNSANLEGALTSVRYFLFDREGSFGSAYSQLLRKTGNQSLFLGKHFSNHRVQLLRVLGEEIELKLVKYTPSSMDSLNDWKQLIRSISDAGIGLDECCDAKRILAIFHRDLSKLQAEKKLSINFPEASTPASRFLARVKNLPESKLVELFKLFEDAGLVIDRSLKDIWPIISEAGLVEQIISSLEFQAQRNDTSVLICLNGQDSRTELHLEKFKALLEPLVGQLGGLDPLIEFLDKRGDFDAEYGRELFEMRQRFPESWDRGAASLVVNEDVFSRSSVRALAYALTKDVFMRGDEDGSGSLSAPAVYEAMLWYAASTSGLGSYQSKALLSKAIASPDIVTYGIPLLSQEEGLKQSVNISEFEQRAMIVVGNLLRDRESKIVVKEGIGNALKYEVGLKAVALRLLDESSYYKSEHQSSAQDVWAMLFAKWQNYSLNYRDLLAKVKKGIEHLNQTCHAPYAQYLFARTGQVIVDAPGGEFKELKQFNAGNDIRRVDWRTSARKGDLYMRTHQEIESRPLCLVYDIEFLAESTTNSNPKPLLDMLTIASLAAREGQKVDLMLFGRGYLTTINDVVTLGNGSAGRVDIKKLEGELTPYLSAACAIADMEQQIYKNKTGYPGVNVFEGSRPQLAKNSIILCGLSEKNFTESAPMLGLFRSKGMAVYRLLPQK